MDFRERLRATLDKKGLSPRKVSLDAGLSDSTVNKILNGGINSPTLETVDKIAEALGVDERWLAYGEGTPDRASKMASLFDKVNEQDKERVLAMIEAYVRTGTDN